MQVQFQVDSITENHASADLVVSDGSRTRDYSIFVGRNYITVYTGFALTRRSPGKTIHDDSEICKHYKRDGHVISQCVKEVRGMMESA